VALNKELNHGKRESAAMYVEDLTRYAGGILGTTKMNFEIGWLRIQFILYCQLGALTGNRPDALVNLCYRHFKLALVRDPEDLTGRYPRLFIELTPEFTKTFLGAKDKYASFLIGLD
jgi:hypothetical protein